MWQGGSRRSHRNSLGEVAGNVGVSGEPFSLVVLWDSEVTGYREVAPEDRPHALSCMVCVLRLVPPGARSPAHWERAAALLAEQTSFSRYLGPSRLLRAALPWPRDRCEFCLGRYCNSPGAGSGL